MATKKEINKTSSKQKLEMFIRHIATGTGWQVAEHIVGYPHGTAKKLLAKPEVQMAISSSRTIIDAQLGTSAKTSFEGGATRSKQAMRFDLMPPAALRALARRLALGAEKHGPRNWEKGGEEFRQATISHLFEHLQEYMQNGNKKDANTDAIICNAAFLCFFEEKTPFEGAK